MTRSFTRHPLAHAALLCAITLTAQAQTQDQKLERVEITGSSIKRIDGRPRCRWTSSSARTSTSSA